EVLLGVLDARIELAEGVPELRVELVLDLRRGLGRAEIPVAQPAGVVERHDLRAFRGGVVLGGTGDAGDVLRRPRRRVDAGLVPLRERLAGEARGGGAGGAGEEGAPVHLGTVLGV